MFIMILCTLCHIIQLSLELIPVSFVFLHLSPYSLFLESLFHPVSVNVINYDRFQQSPRRFFAELGRRAFETARLAYLKVIPPRHFGIDVTLGATINRGSLSLERRLRAVMIIRGRPLPLLHLDKIGRRKGDGSALNEGH